MEKEYTIRNFREPDMDGVFRLWEATGLGDRKRGDNSEVIRRTLSLGGKFFVMEDHGKGEVIGTSWITFDGRRLHLHHFGIAPDYQGKGLAVPLLKESLRYAAKKGVQIKLEVHKDNLKAIQLYTKNHFWYLGDYRIYIIRDLTKIDGLLKGKG